MKKASKELLDLLHNSENFYTADLYTITLIDGATLRYTSLDVDLIVGGKKHKSVAIDRDNITESTSLEVDELAITMHVTKDDVIYENIPVCHAMRAGAFDNAVLNLEVVFSPTPWEYNMPNIPEEYKLTHFLGRMDIEEVDGLTASIKVKAMTELLNVKQPRNSVMPSCLHTIYDSECSLRKTSRAAQGTVTTGSTRSLILCGLTNDDGYFDQGELVFTSGQNVNSVIGIRQYTKGKIIPARPLSFAPSAGDTFTVYPGCDRTMYTCRTHFNNLANFRGYPFVPVPETVM